MVETQTMLCFLFFLFLTLNLLNEGVGAICNLGVSRGYALKYDGEL